jgi:hypothetical protein
MYGHQTRSNKTKCVLWNKGLNHKQKLCELQKWYGHQTRSNKTKQNVYCGARDFFTIGKSYVS